MFTIPHPRLVVVLLAGVRERHAGWVFLKEVSRLEAFQENLVVVRSQRVAI